MIYKGGGVSKKEKEEYSMAIKRNVIESIQVKAGVQVPSCLSTSLE